MTEVVIGRCLPCCCCTGCCPDRYQPMANEPPVYPATFTVDWSCSPFITSPVPNPFPLTIERCGTNDCSVGGCFALWTHYEGGCPPLPYEDPLCGYFPIVTDPPCSINNCMGIAFTCNAGTLDGPTWSLTVSITNCDCDILVLHQTFPTYLECDYETPFYAEFTNIFGDWTVSE